MNNKRPINLNPLTIRLPVMALVSILHRMSGVLVFLLIPVLLLGLQKSLASPEAFAQVKDCLHESLLCKFAVWCLVAGLVFHLFAGIRHLLMDIHIGESREAGRWSARAVIACSALAVVTAFWLWG